VISGGENVAHNADRDDLGIIIGRMAAIRCFKFRAAKSIPPAGAALFRSAMTWMLCG
jgi:hypothetical protein